MGEYAEMMMDGTCCQGCGVFFDDGRPSGYPRFCGCCQRDSDRPGVGSNKKLKNREVALLIHDGGIQVVNPRKITAIPVGAKLFCTPHDLRMIADRMQSGLAVNREHLVAVLCRKEQQAARTTEAQP
jgi:hypothetical protein